MQQAQGTDIVVRAIREGDVEAIVQIDELVTGTKKAGFWRGVLSAYLAGEGEQREGLAPDLCQVAEAGGRVVGFMVGDIQAWQFGMPRAGRIVTIGVHPEHRRRGIGMRLIESLFDIFRKFRVDQVQCLVHEGDPLRDFFAASGLEVVPVLVMGRKL